MGWSSLPNEQPTLRANLAIHNGQKVEEVEAEDVCRDGITGQVNERLGQILRYGPGELNPFHPACRKPGRNFLECETFSSSPNKKVFQELIFLADAIAGLPGIIISEDRYVGDWCLTTPEEVKAHSSGSRSLGRDDWGYMDAFQDDHGEDAFNFRWYGVDNSPLFSPAFMYLIMGLFRQAVRIREEGLDEGIYSAVSRHEISRAMETSDKELAWNLIQRLKPWITGGARRGTLYTPLSGARWKVLEEIYAATRDVSPLSIFGGGLVQSWGLNSLYGESMNGWRNFARVGSGWRVKMKEAARRD